MKPSQRYLFTVSALVLTVFSGLGFYLIRGTPPIKDLVVSGHNHMLSFAFGAILYGLLLGKLNISSGLSKLFAVWMSLTFFGPLGLIVAGLTGKTYFLTTTGVLFEGSFVALWLVLAYFIATDNPQSDKK